MSLVDLPAARLIVNLYRAPRWHGLAGGRERERGSCGATLSDWRVGFSGKLGLNLALASTLVTSSACRSLRRAEGGEI